jgi:hypothetical protein
MDETYKSTGEANLRNLILIIQNTEQKQKMQTL